MRVTIALRTSNSNIFAQLLFLDLVDFGECSCEPVMIIVHLPRPSSSATPCITSLPGAALGSNGAAAVKGGADRVRIVYHLGRMRVEQRGAGSNRHVSGQSCDEFGVHAAAARNSSTDRRHLHPSCRDKNPWADKKAGALLTFLQYSLVALLTLPDAFAFSNKNGVFGILRKPTVVPLRHYVQMAGLFAVMSLLNNIAFAFHISQPLHMVFRSANLMVTYAFGRVLFGKRCVAAVERVEVVTRVMAVGLTRRSSADGLLTLPTNLTAAGTLPKLSSPSSSSPRVLLATRSRRPWWGTPRRGAPPRQLVVPVLLAARAWGAVALHRWEGTC